MKENRHVCEGQKAFEDIEEVAQHHAEWFVCHIHYGDFGVSRQYTPVAYCPYCGVKLEVDV